MRCSERPHLVMYPQVISSSTVLPGDSTIFMSTTSMPTDGSLMMNEKESSTHAPRGTLPRYSATFDPQTIAEIHRAAATGIYDIRGGGAKRKLPHFDDLLFLGASISRYPLEGYRERCGTEVVLGSRFATKTLRLAIPITIAGMSFGVLSAQAKEALGR